MSGPDLEYNTQAIEEDYFDLGSYSRHISTESRAAQIWFDRGLIWAYAFNHEESIKCFERAHKEDPASCMPLWGLAYSYGPNYNKPWEAFDKDEKEQNLQKAKDALVKAEKLAGQGGATAVELVLVKATQKRYPDERTGEDDHAAWNANYAKAMEEVYHEYGSDLDIAALYADSLMNLTPWALWDLHTGKPTDGSQTLQVKSVLDRAFEDLTGARDHPGLLHLYVHLMEMSATSEAALPIANKLRGLVPDGGHLNHMPTHLDVLCGDWINSIKSNTQAIEADERYVARAGALNFYTLYRSHNYHFKVYSAMFAGQLRTALDTVASLEASLSEELLRVESPPMADWLESFLTMRVHVLIRFGLWKEVLNLHLPEDKQLYCVTAAMLHYGKGVALAATGEVQAAEKEQALFRKALDAVPASRTLFNNTAVDILAIGSAMLNGELEYRRGNVDTAFETLQEAARLSDELPYDEPWGWMQPPRHAIGALLLEQGRVEESLQVYKADLGLDDTLPRALRHPKNVWALHGAHECLERLGRPAEAAAIKPQLDEALKQADIAIQSSCYCRNNSAKL